MPYTTWMMISRFVISFPNKRRRIGIFCCCYCCWYWWFMRTSLITRVAVIVKMAVIFVLLYYLSRNEMLLFSWIVSVWYRYSASTNTFPTRNRRIDWFLWSRRWFVPVLLLGRGRLDGRICSKSGIPITLSSNSITWCRGVDVNVDVAISSTTSTARLLILMTSSYCIQWSQRIRT